MLNKIQKAQVCDTRDDDSSNVADKQNQLSQHKPFQKLCIEITATETFVLH